jgi:F0F1-type ATP synthase assembly protein I
MIQRSEQRRRLLWGAVCTLVVSGIAVAIWGRHAVVGAASFGAVATTLQVVAAQLMARTGKPAALDHLTVYVIGVFLRLLGVVLFGVAVALDRATFAPWPSALGYLGTILPLLYLETKLGR